MGREYEKKEKEKKEALVLTPVYMLQAIREVRHFMKCLKMSGIS